MIKVTEKALTALTLAFGIDKDALIYLGGGYEGSDGIVYTFGQKGQEKVFKVMGIPEQERERALEQMALRLEFVRFLGENGVDIVYPIPNEAKRLMESFHDAGTLFVGYVMERVCGKHPGKEDLHPEFYRQYGRTIGKLHRLTRQYPLWKGGGPEGDTGVLGWREEVRMFYNWCKDPEIKACWSQMEHTLEQLPVNRESYGFIHNDAHLHNMFKTQGKLVLLDFDVANFQWFAVDIAIAVQALLFTKFGGMEKPVTDLRVLEEFLYAFMEGYELENHIDLFWLKNLDIFMHYRRMLIYTVFQDGIAARSEEHRQSWKRVILEKPMLAGRIYQ